MPNTPPVLHFREALHGDWEHAKAPLLDMLDLLVAALNQQSVTRTAALTLNELIVGAGDSGLKVVPATNGQVPIGSSVDGSVRLATLTPGSGVSITNGPGAVTIAATGGSGTVTNTGTLTSGKTIQGNGGTDVTASSLTATVTKYTSGTPSAATDGTDYLSPATGMTKIQQIVTAGSQASVDFTSIPGTYASLLVTWQSQNTNSGTGGSSTYLKMNNDATAGNYTAASRIGVQNTSPTAGAAISATTNGMYVNDMPNAGNTGIAGIGQILFVGYAGTTFHKDTWTSWETEWSGLIQVFTIRARWKSTAAITRLTFTVDTGAFTNGSVFTLYGLP